jgi:hypothetical protein
LPASAAAAREKELDSAGAGPQSSRRDHNIVRTMKTVHLLSVVCAFLTTAAAARTFTDQKGRTFEGSLVAVDSTSAEVLRGDGKKFKVPLETLSADDRKFCEEWRAANPVLKLTVKADSVTADGSRESASSSSQSSGSNSSSANFSRSRAREEGYRITVSNWSKDPGTKVSGLTVDYALVIGFFDTTAKDKRGVKEIVRGSGALPELTGSKAESLLTQTVKTTQTAAVATRTQRNSGGSTSSAEAAAVYRESLDGICLVVRHGERVVATLTTGRVPKELPGELLLKK